MNKLDRVLQAAGPLLRRVDDVVAGVGAPPDHAVWAQLRRVRLLPMDAVSSVASLRPGALGEAVGELRADARVFADVAGGLPGAGAWSGDAASSYVAARAQLAGQLGGGPESLEERLDATADLAAALHEWMISAQDELAGVLAQVLRSAQALEVPVDGSAEGDVGGGVRESLAAADIAARVLHQVADSYDQAEDLLHGSQHLAEMDPLTARRW